MERQPPRIPPPRPRDEPSHPVLQATALMVGITLVLVAMAVMSVLG